MSDDLEAKRRATLKDYGCVVESYQTHGRNCRCPFVGTRVMFSCPDRELDHLPYGQVEQQHESEGWRAVHPDTTHRTFEWALRAELEWRLSELRDYRSKILSAKRRVALALERGRSDDT